MPACKHCRAAYITLPESCHCCKAPLREPQWLDIERMEHRLAFVRNMADSIIAEADRLGVVLNIETMPMRPLAMGHHVMQASVRPARDMAQPVTRGRSGE